MRANPLLLGLLLSATVASASDPSPATQHLSAPCELAASGASSLFTRHGFGLTPDHTCLGCLSLEITLLQDLQGHSVTSVRTVMDRYMTVGHEHDVPGAWYVHTHLTTHGHLTLTPEVQGCLAQLLFQFTWYATEFLAIVPVDGDRASRPSNLKLESDYLAALANAKP